MRAGSLAPWTNDAILLGATLLLFLLVFVYYRKATPIKS